MHASELLDRYLLGEPISKPDVVVAVLADRSAAPAAAPFYRALEAVGARAADEAFVALRLILAERSTDDAVVRRLRALASMARAAQTGDTSGFAAIVRRDETVLGDLPLGEEQHLVAAAARTAYLREVGS